MRIRIPVILATAMILGAAVAGCYQEKRAIYASSLYDFDPTKLSYYSDHRTGLCYAALHYGSGHSAGFSFTNVSCDDPRVGKMILDTRPMRP